MSWKPFLSRSPEANQVAPPMSRFSLLTALSLCLNACSCGQQTPPPTDAVEDPDELVLLMQARLEDLHSARVRVVSEYYGDGVRGANFRQVVLVRQPEDLHIQVLSPIDQPLSVMVTNGERLIMYDLEANLFYYGSPTPENIARILPLYLSAADIVRVLLGGPPLELLLGDGGPYELEWDEERGSYRLHLLHSWGGSLSLWIRHGDWLLEAAEQRDADGELIFELRTGEFEEFSGALVPTRLRFLMEGEHPVDMSMEVESIDLNVDLPDSLFTLQAPPNAEQIDLDE